MPRRRVEEAPTCSVTRGMTGTGGIDREEAVDMLVAAVFDRAREGTDRCRVGTGVEDDVAYDDSEDGGAAGGKPRTSFAAE